MAMAEPKREPQIQIEPKVVPHTPEKSEPLAIPVQRAKMNYWRLGILAFIVVSIFATMTIVSSMVVTNKNRQLQDIQTNSTLMQRENDTLLQSAQELSQYDRVNRIAKEKGLQMNENNVRNVKP